MEEEFTEGLFRCLCLTGNAITRLQVERMMHPKMRSRISELTDSSQVPPIVKQARKDKSFFREKAGEPKSTSQDSSSEFDSETDPPMRKKKRDFRRYKHKNFRPPRYTSHRRSKPTLGAGRYFKGKRRRPPPRLVQFGGGDTPRDH
jgi:hypothetical protein